MMQNCVCENFQVAQNGLFLVNLRWSSAFHINYLLTQSHGALLWKVSFARWMFWNGGGCRWHLDMDTKKMQSKDTPQNYSTFPNCIFFKIQNNITYIFFLLFGASREHICVGVNGKSCNEQMLQLLVMIIIRWAYPDNLKQTTLSTLWELLFKCWTCSQILLISYYWPLSVPRSLRSHQSA